MRVSFGKKKTNLKGKNARDNKQFWRNVKPFNVIG